MKVIKGKIGELDFIKVKKYFVFQKTITIKWKETHKLGTGDSCL
jgi:hypothetical protein